MKENKKTYIGQVVSEKMEKTIIVAITSRKLHPLYKKYVVYTKKVKAHDENSNAHLGDTVEIVECRPLSREKCWRLLTVLDRAK